MNTNDGLFGQTLAAWLQEDAEHRVSDHLGEVLVRTAATRQRAWWSSPERWLPVDTTTNLGGRISLPRAVLVIALLGLLVLAVVGAALLTGTVPRSTPTVGIATNGRIYIANGATLTSYAADGTDPKVVLTLDGTTSELAFSPDGKRLAYDLDVVAGRIDVLDIASGAVVPITVRGSTALGGPIGWSPDGQQLVFSMFDGAHEHLYVASADGSNVKELDTSAIDVTLGRWAGGWSPGGDLIAFVANDADSGVGTTYVIHPDGSGLHQVSATPVVGGSVSWSPDPTVKRLLYTQDGNHVQFMDVMTGAITPVEDSFWPTWSPNGDRIATWQAEVLQTVDVLSNAPRPVVVAPTWSDGSNCQDHPDMKDRTFCGPMSWSPDGTRVYAPDITGTSILSVLADGKGSPIVIPLDSNVVDITHPMAWQPIRP